ncbi:dolichol-phosphate mannosyltransferase subunit 3-like [Dreissena polymorpha]|uniref:Dolichol-phosphate mannosyltransferase subunit 3 n=1 Tax=Dreissena polymorpha TaxID=45954 RepID=A0A9D4HHH0_DREPO|nr:dolichol-phosphate mannosyltransferase subunit 3-like [Dreissena polymorpha]KAH3717619.1 hypothetical protein DPMN_060412 [Dreissena polymorpha]
MIPKLFQWLLAGVTFIVLWIALVLGYREQDGTSTSTPTVVLFLPLYVIITFGLFSVAVIGYRVATFNDCIEAAKELQTEIEEAKADLKSKGFKFD